MKVIVASSDRNRIEERVAVHSLLRCGHSADDIDVIDGETGLIYDGLRNDSPREIEISGLGHSTSFTFARLYLPLFYDDDRIVILDSDVIAYQHLEGIFAGAAPPGIYVRKAYSPGEWATSVMGWRMSPEIRSRLDKYRTLIDSSEFAWQDKIYLKPNFANAIGIPINRIEKSWNSFDSIDKTTRVAHFTNLATQPWKRADHPYEFDWFVLAQDALASGILTQEDIEIQKQFGQLRTDFDQKLRNPLSREDTFTRLVNQARLFYRNLKFHSPVKYMYSELVN